MSMMRAYRAGESIEDFCRACKTDRMHTIVVVDTVGQPIRVACGYCRSEHNFRGGPRVAPWSGAARSEESRPPETAPAPMRRASLAGDALPLVSERERTGQPDVSAEAGYS